MPKSANEDQVGSTEWMITVNCRGGNSAAGTAGVPACSVEYKGLGTKFDSLVDQLPGFLFTLAPLKWVVLSPGLKGPKAIDQSSGNVTESSSKRW
jgi:hypothetical protein